MAEILYHCVFCNKTGQKEAEYPVRDLYNNQYSIVHCPGCGTYSLQPPPTDEILRRAYDDTYYGETRQKFSFPLVERTLDWFRESRGRRLSRHLDNGDIVVDLGCGNGKFLQSLTKRKKIIPWGIEPPGKSAERASSISEINIITGTLCKEDFKPESVKAVTLFHVFEHVPNPQEILDIIDQILLPGGYLIMSFPNISSWQSKIFKGNWLHLDPPRHLFFPDPELFKTVMKDRGFRLLREYYGSFEQNPFGAVQSILNCISAKREILFEHMKGNKKYILDYPRYKLTLHKLFFFLSFPVFMLTNMMAALYKKGATVEFTFQKLN
ncbi:MAG: class I SAM-dependent methyltransferase [Bacteroidales bacterium]